MNPYASHLGSRNPRAVIAESPEKLAALAQQLGPAGLERSPAPGKWSPREILCHLADCETVFAFRLRQALAEPHHVIQPFDQDLWAARYATMDAHAALAVFTSVRRWNIALLDAVPAGLLSKKVTHPERGEMTFQTVVETMGGHDLNHIAQIENIAAEGAPAKASA